MVILIVLDGRELAWVNLGACGADVRFSLNALRMLRLITSIDYRKRNCHILGIWT